MCPASSSRPAQRVSATVLPLKTTRTRLGLHSTVIGWAAFVPDGFDSRAVCEADIVASSVIWLPRPWQDGYRPARQVPKAVRLDRACALAYPRRSCVHQDGAQMRMLLAAVVGITASVALAQQT